MELWVGCVAGALTDSDYLAKLQAAGFEGGDIEVTRVYSAEDAKEFLAGQTAELQQLAQQVDGTFVSGFVRAVKPMAPAAAGVAAGAAPQALAAPAAAAQASPSPTSSCGPRCC
jgi:hypothetical protein